MINLLRINAEIILNACGYMVVQEGIYIIKWS